LIVSPKELNYTAGCVKICRTRLVGVALAIFAATVWLFWPSVHGEFLGGDDVEYLRQSERWNGLTWNAVKRAFTSTYFYYHPLTRLTHVLDYQIWGTNAAGHHATSVFLHALNVALVFGFLWTLLGAVSLSTGERLMVALWVAAVFAIHPLQVESVAWIAVRTQLLYATFGIGSLWAYTAGARRWVVWGLYVAALLSKPIAVSLPFVMLAIDYYPLRRYERFGWGRLVWEKAVMIALAVAASFATIITESRQSGLASLSAAVPLSLRVFLMVKSLTFYPLKLLWPAHLSPSYPIPWGLSLDQWPVLASVLSVVMITATVVIERQRRPMLAAAWGAYVVLVLPVSGLMLTGDQSVAQRYAYVAMLPLLLLAGGGVVWFWRRSTTVVRLALIGLLAGQLCIFAVRTRGLIPDWHTDETKQRAIVVALPNSEQANRLFAMWLLNQGRAGEALAYAQRDVEIAPQAWQAHMTLGSVLKRLGRLQEAMAQDEEAFRLNSDSALGQYNFGLTLMESGRVPEAAEHFEQALRMKPDFAEAHAHLGVALGKLGKPDDAIRHYEAALRIEPDYAEAHVNLGSTLATQGRTQEAIRHYDEALRIEPGFAGAYYDRGVILEQIGRLPDAVADYEQALRIKPDYARAHFQLGTALEKLGRSAEAIAEYKHVLKLRPDFLPARNALTRLGAGP
jgi:tetratricopeptide (TPR) repeat protein